VPTICFFAPTDRFGEMDRAKGSFGALEPNSGCWSSRASKNFDVLARNLTFAVSSSRATTKRLVVTANIVPLEAIEQSDKRPFAASV
jgi:hypothetical protein